MRYILALIFILLFTSYEFAQEYITPTIITTLSSDVNESSGLININGKIWTHNDHGGSALLYQIDTTNGNILQTTVVQNAENKDWEDLTRDEGHLYIGDFGNNAGNRTDLKIYKIKLYDLANYNVVDSEIINFSYSDQTSWEENQNNHDFDCEAMICVDSSLYLFSKSWVSQETKVYQISKQPGTYIAQYLNSYDVDGLITGAEILNSGTLTLIGYKTNGISFTWVFDGYDGVDFFSGNKTKLNWTQVTQIEGVCYADANGIYIGSEEYGGILDPTLYYLDIGEFVTLNQDIKALDMRIYSIDKTIFIKPLSSPGIIRSILISDLTGVIIKEYYNVRNEMKIPLNVSAGMYIVSLKTDEAIYSKKVMLY